MKNKSKIQLNKTHFKRVKLISNQRPFSPRRIVIKRTQYRDKTIISPLKRMTNFYCQNCEKSFKTRRSLLNVAHIHEHCHTRDNRVENLFVLCVACHSIFDCGTKRERRNIYNRVVTVFTQIKYVPLDYNEYKETTPFNSDNEESETETESEELKFDEIRGVK